MKWILGDSIIWLFQFNTERVSELYRRQMLQSYNLMLATGKVDLLNYMVIELCYGCSCIDLMDFIKHVSYIYMTFSLFSFFDCKYYRYATYTRSAIYFFYINSIETKVEILFSITECVLTCVSRIIYTLYNILTPRDWEDDNISYVDT